MHVTVRTEEEEVLFSTRGQDGGAGQALAFVLGEGQRAPRAWEIVLTGWRLAWWRGEGGAVKRGTHPGARWRGRRASCGSNGSS